MEPAGGPGELAAVPQPGLPAAGRRAGAWGVIHPVYRAYARSLGFQPMTRQEASLFFRLVSYRYQRGSTLITTNKSVMDWPEVLAGDEVMAAALLDRLLPLLSGVLLAPESPGARVTPNPSHPRRCVRHRVH